MRRYQKIVPAITFPASLVLLILSAPSCNKDDDGTVVPPGTGPDSTNTESVCDTSLTPIVMVHGFLGSGDTYALQALRFASNEYCKEYLFTYDWNSLGSQNNADGLDAFIDNILAQTSKTRVNLVGHSAGGGIGYDYLSIASRAAKVDQYVHIASSNPGQAAGPSEEIPTLNIWSDGDEVNSGSDIVGAENLMIPGKDHYQILTNTETFTAIFKWFNNDAEPTTTAIVEEDDIQISGKAVVFAENSPVTGGTVDVYMVDQATGFRLDEYPRASFTIDQGAHWGPFDAEQGAYYEFKVTTGIPGDVPVHYYREPFVRSNSLVYVRTMPPPGSLAGVLLSSLPRDDGQAVIAVFASNQAVIDGRDELIIDGTELSTNEFASADQTAIAFFLFDDNDNQRSDLTAVGLFAQFPFMNGIDMYFQASSTSSISMSLNGRTLNVPKWPSDSEGYVVPVFD